MGCRCNERRAAIRSAASAVARGDVTGAVNAARNVTRTLAEDARSGALQRAAAARLAQLRATIRR
jgi:hypothetical protein